MRLTTEEVELKKVMVEKIHVAARKAMTGQMLHDLKADVSADFLLDGLVASLSTYVVGEPPTSVDCDVTFYRPASWWQHFKQAHFPKWAERRWPVEYAVLTRTVTFEGRYLYPDAPALSSFGRTGVYTESRVGPESVRPAGNNSELS